MDPCANLKKKNLSRHSAMDGQTEIIIPAAMAVANIYIFYLLSCSNAGWSMIAMYDCVAG